MSLDLYSEKKRVSVTFAGDDDVGKHISSLSAKRCGSRKKASQPVLLEEDGSTSNEDDDSENEGDLSQDEVFKASQALAEETKMSGDQVFGFVSMKRSGQMAKVASRAVEAVTPVSKPPSNTPKSKSILKKTKGVSEILVESGDTPVTKRSSRRVQCLASSTPQRISARLAQSVHDSSSEESICSESDGESDDSDASSASSISSGRHTRGTPSKATPAKGTPAKGTPAKGTPAKGTPAKGTPAKGTPAKGTPAKGTPAKGTPAKDTPSRSDKENKKPAKRGKRGDFDGTVQTDVVEEYFDVHSSSSVVTSDRTLSRLDTPRMDHQAIAEVLSHLKSDYISDTKHLIQEYRTNFNPWMFLLCHGYNLVFHGLGSKRQLLEEFRSEMLSDLNHIVVNGYFPSLTVKNILNAITEEIMEHDGSFRSPSEQYDFIRRHYECGEQEDFYLVIHNIDGAMLRNEKTQTILSLLAQVRGIHILASIDHINAPLMWDSTKCSRFNWLWYDVTTYDSYSEETSYENSLLVQQSGTLALSSLTHVMRSLTPNAKGIFYLLVRHQLEYGKDNSAYQGLSFTDLYQKCREAFLVNSDLTLNTQLTEFKDHKLIKLKKAADGVEYLTVPLDDATLKEFLEQQESEES